MSLTARDVMKRGLRLIGGIASGDDPESDELTEAFVALNTMISAMFGTIIGPRLSPQPLTATGQAENGGLYQCALSAAATLTAPLKPRNGCRFGVVDVKANFATNNLTIAPNGQLFETSPNNLVLSTNGSIRRWFFDGATGNWNREADLANLDTSPPFPDPLIAYLPQMFAMAYAAEIGGTVLSADTLELAKEGRMAFARTYSRRGRNQGDAPFGAGQG